MIGGHMRKKKKKKKNPLHIASILDLYFHICLIHIPGFPLQALKEVEEDSSRITDRHSPIPSWGSNRALCKSA